MERVSALHTEELEEMLGAYALDALEPDEVEVMEAHLATCPRCRQEVQSHLEIAGMIGSVGQEAPPGVWDKIAAGLSEAPPRVTLDRVGPESAQGVSAPGVSAPGVSPRVVSLANRRPGSPRRAPTSRRTRMLGALGGLAAAVVIAVLGVQVIRLNDRVNHVSSALQAAQAPTMATVGAALSSPGARQVALSPLTGGPALAQVVIASDGTGYLYGSRMPALAADRTYELWGIVDNTRVPYGLMGAVPATVTRFQAKGQSVALAVTVEKAGGVATSSRPPVALGSFTNV